MEYLAAEMNHFFSFPENIEKFVLDSRSQRNTNNRVMDNIPADILETPKVYIFLLDVPGLSKSDIQVTVEDNKTLVIKSIGKRKREDGEEEDCKYLRLERRKAPPQKMMRKFRLPENANLSAVTAKSENGVLTVTVEKLLPPPRGKTVQVAISSVCIS